MGSASISVDEFQALEQKVLQTVELIKKERDSSSSLRAASSAFTAAASASAAARAVSAAALASRSFLISSTV